MNPTLGRTSDVLAKLQQMLLKDFLRPGHILTEEIACEQTNASRGSVREALSFLDAMGVIEKKPRSVTTVTKLEKEQREEIMLIRRLVEPKGVNKIIEKLKSPPDKVAKETADELHQLRDFFVQLCADLEDKKSHGGDIEFSDYLEPDLKFHVGLAELAGQKETARIVANLIQKLYFLVEIEYPLRNKDKVLNEHKICSLEHIAILDAILAKEATLARRNFKKHLNTSRDLWKLRWENYKPREAPFERAEQPD